MSSFTVLTATHAFAAAVALPLGTYQLVRRVKGDRRHRLAGWTWVAAMVFVATSSFAIRDLRDGRLSLLHVLSVVTLVSLVVGIVQARRGRVAAHKGAMRGSWLGLIGAFAGAVAVPDRAIPTFAVTEPAGATGTLVAVLTTAAVIVGLAALFERRGVILRAPGAARSLPSKNVARRGRSTAAPAQQVVDKAGSHRVVAAGAGHRPRPRPTSPPSRLR